MIQVLVLGGHGFIGRYAVQALARLENVSLVVGSREPTNHKDLDARSYKLHQMTASSDWHDVVKEFDVVLNCVGILRQVLTSTYHRVQTLAPAAIAQACVGTNTRFVHVSALGLATSDRSRFLTSKRLGEDAIKQTACDWIIVRPSLLEGEGGFGAAWLRGIARLPFFVVPADAQGRIAALKVEELGEALAQLCVGGDAELGLNESREFELGGEQTFTFDAYIRGLRSLHTDKPGIAIPVPGMMARIGAHLCDLVHFTPFSFGHWELLRKDNVPNPNRIRGLLGRAPALVIQRASKDLSTQ